MKKQKVVGGRYYGRLTLGGPLVPTMQAVGEPDAWICRRVADFPRQEVPAGGAVGSCSRCAAAIVFNPQRTVSAIKVCMQCAAIRPLPIED